MKTINTVVLLLFLSLMCKAQDTTKVKDISHEIGFNTVSLIKQVVSNNPTSTLPQLPYDFFYNVFFKEKVGARLGVGLNLVNTESSVTGQAIPRVTKKIEADYRLGVAYNFVSYKRLTLSGFFDYVGAQYKNETSTTTTVQAFPNPIENISTVTSDVTKVSGAQVGVGLKYNIHKHLSIYAEMPVGLYVSNFNAEVSITQAGVKDITRSSSKTTNSQAILPTTIYLVLRF